MGSAGMTLDGLDLDPSLLELGIIGFAEAELQATEGGVTLHGTGFRARLKLSIDGKKLPGAQVRWRTNSSLELHWKDLMPGEHVLSIKDGERTLQYTFSTLAAPPEETQDK